MTKQRFFISTALIAGLGVGAVAAQTGTGSAQDSKDQAQTQKSLEAQKLNPDRPIRKVGPKEWPAANPLAEAPEQNATEQKNKSAQSPSVNDETTGQAADSATSSAKLNRQPSGAATQTHGQATAQAPATATQSNNQPSENAAQTATNGQTQAKTQTSAPSAHLGADASGRVAVNTEQEHQLSAALSKQHIQPVTNIDVRVGVAVPASVRLGAVSADLVAVLPQFSGYSFFATRDQIVIVEPSTKQVVALVPVTLTSAASVKPAKEKPVTRETRRAPAKVERDVTVGVGVREKSREAPVVIRRERRYEAVPADGQVIIETRPSRRIFLDDDD